MEPKHPILIAIIVVESSTVLGISPCDAIAKLSAASLFDVMMLGIMDSKTPLTLCITHLAQDG